MRIILTEGQVHDIRQAEALIEGFACEKVLADKGYDSDKFREVIASKGAEAVIPPKRSRKELIPYDKDVYQDRNLVERFFNKIKNFRRIATRYDKTALSLRLIPLTQVCLYVVAAWRRIARAFAPIVSLDEVPIARGLFVGGESQQGLE